MDFETIKSEIYKMNEDEIFYQRYYNARREEASLQQFLSELDMNDVHKRHLLIPELPETIPPRFEDSFFFADAPDASMLTLRHNRYSPAILHEHTFFELIYVHDGSCEQTICGNRITLHNGDLCIVPPGVAHSIGAYDNNSVIFNCLMRKSTLHNVFFNFLSNPNILTAFFLNHIYSENNTDYIVFHTGNDYELHRAFIYMYMESLNRDMFWDQIISYTLMLSFGVMIRSYGNSYDIPAFTTKADSQRFELIQYIQKHYSTVTLDSAAAHFHYTPEYTSRLIKRATGRTFTQLLQQVRLEKAKVLLQDTRMTIAAVTEQIGYDSTEHFVRLFKKTTGLTPTEYRRGGTPL